MASIKIKDFFNGRFFEIPKYQRGYAWEIQNIRELFEDILESIESASNHYIGTIVLSKSTGDEEKFYVVDGQQRTTTIALIISALIKRLPEKDAAFYERFYLKEDDRYRITPLSRDQQFFTALLEDKIGEPQNKSQRYLKDALTEIKSKVDHIEDKLKFLKSVEKLEVMEFIENSEGDAIRIFQTVNDRGKPLSNMEKAKSLLIYFSNRYLGKRLDNTINDYFSDIFEIYDDIKLLADKLGINLIKNRDFNEDNLMRYHFVTFSNENYDATAGYVLQYLKNQLTGFRVAPHNGSHEKMEAFILTYITSLKAFFRSCREVIEHAKLDPEYFKLFVILNLSATLYPVIIKLGQLNLLERPLTGIGREGIRFLNLIELIEVRVYKTRATDPKADIAKLVHKIEEKSPGEIENWLIWFNNRWMPKEEFQSNLSGSIYGNRALNHIFISYCEHLSGQTFDIQELEELAGKSPNIEHILSQTPTFDPNALGFNDKEDFIDYEHTLGNLTILEKGLNSTVQNKNPIDKIDGYDRSNFSMTKRLSSEIDTKRRFTKDDLRSRTTILAEYCSKRWWSERPVEVPAAALTDEEQMESDAA